MGELPDRIGFRGMAKLGLVHTLYKDGTAHRYEKGIAGKLGRFLLTPIEWPLHHILREITNPLTILGLTMVSLAGTSVAFYPKEFRDTVTLLIPAANKIQPWMLKFGLWALLQSTALSIGLRAYGRFSNPELVRAWRHGEIEGQWIGHAHR